MVILSGASRLVKRSPTAMSTVASVLASSTSDGLSNCAATV